MQAVYGQKCKKQTKCLIFIELKMVFINKILHFVSYFSNLG